MNARKVRVFFHRACIAAVLVIAMLWARSHRASDSVSHASQDGDVRRGIAVSSSRGLLTFTRSSATANHHDVELGLRFTSDSLDRSAALVMPVEVSTYAGGFVWMHRPHAAGTPIESAWTFVAAPWWSLAALVALPLLMQPGRRSPAPATRVAERIESPVPVEALRLAA